METALLSESEWATVNAAREGDRESVARLTQAYSKRVFAYLYRMTNDAEHAHDLAQETLQAVLTSLQTLRDDNSFEAWLFSIATRKAHAWVKNRLDHKTLDPERLTETVDDRSLDPASIVVNAEDAALLRAAVENLPPLQKSAFLLYYMEELTYAQIAEALSCKIGTVRSRLYYAKATIARLLQNGEDAHGKP